MICVLFFSLMAQINIFIFIYKIIFKKNLKYWITGAHFERTS
ncbi:hypothetical protein FM120_18200 [Sphingobacterium faecium PCAi_F2.5]|nr:hypothetical protein FM120_18200 [Sphingobacterium faecium PCAi_F2.5]